MSTWVTTVLISFGKALLVSLGILIGSCLLRFLYRYWIRKMGCDDTADDLSESYKCELELQSVLDLNHVATSSRDAVSDMELPPSLGANASCPSYDSYTLYPEKPSYDDYSDSYSGNWKHNLTPDGGDATDAELTSLIGETTTVCSMLTGSGDQPDRELSSLQEVPSFSALELSRTTPSGDTALSSSLPESSQTSPMPGFRDGQSTPELPCHSLLSADSFDKSSLPLIKTLPPVPGLPDSPGSPKSCWSPSGLVYRSPPLAPRHSTLPDSGLNHRSPFSVSSLPEHSTLPGVSCSNLAPSAMSDPCEASRIQSPSPVSSSARSPPAVPSLPEQSASPERLYSPPLSFYRPVKSMPDSPVSPEHELSPPVPAYRPPLHAQSSSNTGASPEPPLSPPLPAYTPPPAIQGLAQTLTYPASPGAPPVSKHRPQSSKTSELPAPPQSPPVPPYRPPPPLRGPSITSTMSECPLPLPVPTNRPPPVIPSLQEIECCGPSSVPTHRPAPPIPTMSRLTSSPIPRPSPPVPRKPPGLINSTKSRPAPPIPRLPPSLVPGRRQSPSPPVSYPSQFPLSSSHHVSSGSERRHSPPVQTARRVRPVPDPRGNPMVSGIQDNQGVPRLPTPSKQQRDRGTQLFLSQYYKSLGHQQDNGQCSPPH